MLFDDVKKNFSCTTEKYLKFAENKNQCSACELFNSYKVVVSSEGNTKNPTFMFCGESPGQQEINKGRPMIGPAGQLLREHLRMFGFNKTNTVITNVMPCRPLDNIFPKDWDVVKKCFNKWLAKEIEILKPKIIITCGAPAMRAIRNKIGVSDNRGVWEFLPARQAYSISTWHPSYVLRCKNDPNKQNVSIEFKNDIKRVATEWKFIYTDNRLHLKGKEYNKKITEDIISTHKEQLIDFLLEEGDV